ncbi:hypothetical protein PYV61_17230, partial [Roseisolibacter sp. H3M3-2]
MRRAFPLSVVAACLAAAAPALGAQSLAGRWSYEESGQEARLELRHDAATGRVTGTFTLGGRTAALAGRAAGTTLVVDTFDGEATGDAKGTMSGRLDGGLLLLTVVQPGQPTVTLPMARQGAAAPEPAVPEPAAPPRVGDVPAGDAGLAGRWEAADDEGARRETLELTVAGGEARGRLRVTSRGHFSGRVTDEGGFALLGAAAGAPLRLRVWPEGASEAQGVDVTATRRGEYLVLSDGRRESGYARPGRPLVREAGG